MEKDRGKFLFEIKHPFLKEELSSFFFCWFLFLGWIIVLIYYNYEILDWNLKNLLYDRSFLVGLSIWIIFYIYGYFGYFYVVKKTHKFIPFKIYEKGILIPDVVGPEIFVFFDEIKSITLWISYPKGKTLLKINKDYEIPSKCLQKGIPIIKRVLGGDWDKYYHKYEYTLNVKPRDWNIARKILKKEPLNIDYINDFGFGNPLRAKYFAKRRVFNFLISSIKYEIDTGKKIIPEDIKVPEKFHKIARKINLDL